MTDREKEPVKYAVEVIAGADPFAQLVGVKVEEAKDSYARTSLTVKKEHCNAVGRTHGGVLFTLADETFAVAVHARGLHAFALEIKINDFEATRVGDVLSAEATPVDVRTRVSLWNVDVTNQKGQKIAQAQGLAYHTR
jgi:acyl-CoA thioesterase